MAGADAENMLQVKLEPEVTRELVSVYLGDTASFWRNVQEPSSRVADRVLLARLAAIALARFEYKFVRAAAVVNLFYRSAEQEWCEVVDADVLPQHAHQIKNTLLPEASFDDCRWFLSLLLGEAAFWMSRGDFAAATRVLQEVEPVRELAFGHGQLYTNVVKALLLRLVAGTRDGYRADSRAALAEAADKTIAIARQVPQNYLFSNQYAFEEVAYVYTMIRQIYNWRCLSDQVGSDLAELERAGFAWRCVSTPFPNFIV